MLKIANFNLKTGIIIFILYLFMPVSYSQSYELKDNADIEFKHEFEGGVNDSIKKWKNIGLSISVMGMALAIFRGARSMIDKKDIKGALVGFLIMFIVFVYFFQLRTT